MSVTKPTIQAMAEKEYPTAKHIEMKKYSTLVNADKLAIKPLEGKFCNQVKISALNVAKCVGKIFAVLLTPFFAVWVALSNLSAKIMNKNLDASNKIILGNREIFVKEKESELAIEVADAAKAKETAKLHNKAIACIKEHKGSAAAVATAVVAVAVSCLIGGSFDPSCAIRNC